MLGGPSGEWTAAALLALLGGPADEWRHKVGVAGPADGSAKPTTRLLAAGGFVLKTRVDHARDTPEAALATFGQARVRGRSARLWHPTKAWAAMRAGGQWYPLTACRELVTLRQLTGRPQRLAAWVEMLRVSADAWRFHGLGLDVNPANFAWEGSGSRLYYVDDELYERFDARTVAGAIAGRFAEEPEITAAEWAAWAGELYRALELTGFGWGHVAEELRLFPLTERWEGARRALLGELEHAPAARARGGRGGERVAVLADVHANLPALEAVLSDARAQGAAAFLFLGDAVGYGPHPRECVERLAELPQLVAVKGNHDHAVASGELELGMNRLARASASWTRSTLSAAHLAWLEALPPEHDGEGWLAVHGAPRDPRRFLAYVYELSYEDNLAHLRARGRSLCFHGHTHVQEAHAETAVGPARLSGARSYQPDPRRPWLVNPGSVGQPRDGDPRAAYALWNRKTGALAAVRVAYDVERTLVALRAAALDPDLVDRLRAGR